MMKRFFGARVVTGACVAAIVSSLIRPVVAGSEAETSTAELVMVTAMLPHVIAKGYGDPAGQIVSRVNETGIRNLRHLVETLRDATGRFVEIDFADAHVETLVFDRQEVLDAMEGILAENGIRRQGSADRLAAWEAKKSAPVEGCIK